MAIVSGVDIVDTCILDFAGGPGAPSFEMIQIIADKLGIDTGVNLEAVVKINKELKVIRQELAEFDTCKLFPIDFPTVVLIVKILFLMGVKFMI